MQRRATKLPKISKLPHSERLRQLDLPTLRYRRIWGDMIEVFKVIKHYDRSQSNPTDTRQQCNSYLRLYSFSIRVINNWNNLSNHVVSSSNTNTFKNRRLNIHTGNITQLDTTGKLVTTSILVLPILIINGEIRSHSGSVKRGGICLLPEFTIR